MTNLCIAAVLVAVSACSNTADGVKKDADSLGDKTAAAATDAGNAMGAATQTADIKTALMADSTVDASGINVDTNGDTKTVTLNGTVANETQKMRAEAIAKEKAPGYTVVNNLTIR
jgi:osmotically-inducible protein OsmY